MKKKTRIAVLFGQLTVLGGSGIAVVNEVRELRKMGVDAELVILFRKEQFNSVKNYHAEDIPVIFLSDSLPRIFRFNFKFPIFSFFSLFHLSSIFWAPKLLKSRNYDVLLAHETYNCFSAIASAKYSGAKLITFIWDPVSYIVPRVYGKGFLRFFLPLIIFISKSIDKFILNHCDSVLICSSLHEQVLRKLNNKVPMIKVFPGAEVLEKLPKKKEKIIVSLTKWDIGKNPEFLLQVASCLKQDFRWFIAGNWVSKELEDDFKQKIKQYGLEEKFVLTGKIFGRKKMDFLAQARVLVHPIVEAFGMFALEAAACGCPIILPKTSGVCELFVDGKHGFFPEEGNVKKFAECLNLFLDDEKKSLEMGKSAWLVAKKYSWKSHALKIADVINNNEKLK